jgi:glycosyltransferase involved in cell wall biosynthesis
VALAGTYTIVTPTFEHASSIGDYLEATLRSASLPFHWIIVDDASADGTADRVEEWLAVRRSPLIARTTVIRNERPLFETACDNIGFRAAETEIIVEIQADIHVGEPRFDALMIEALDSAPRPSAISGRCGHTFAALKPSSIGTLLRRPTVESVGLCGKAIENPRREHHFFLGNDDHDYHRRLFEAERRRPLYVPMTIHAPLRLGAMRRKRTGINKEVFDRLSTEKRGSPAWHRFLASIDSSTPPQRIK